MDVTVESVTALNSTETSNRKPALHRKPNIVTCCILAVFVAAFLVIELPGNSVVSNELQNAGHTLAFAALTFAALFRTTLQCLPTRTLFLIVTLMTFMGILIELGQWVTGRGFSAMDIAKDLVGISAGVCLYFAVAWSGKTKLRLFAFSAGSLILVGSLSPTLALSLSRKLAPPLPILVDFEQWGVAHRIRNSDTVMTIGYDDNVWKTNHTLSAEVQYLPGRWPSIQFIEPYTIWHQFAYFTFSVYNPQADVVTINPMIPLDRV